MAAYLAIDLGTTGCRSILFDSELNQIADCYREYGLITPRDNWVEQDANLWWSLTVQTAKAAIATAQIAPYEINAISISSQGITCVPVDKDLNPLCNALSWLDVRAQKQAAQIDTDFGQRAMFTLTGKPIDAVYFLPKLLWIKENLPHVYEKAYKFLMPLDFLIAKLTGNCVTDHSMASGTLLYDIKNKAWSKTVLDAYGIEERRLPSLLWAGEPAGTVLPEAAAALGVSEDCIVAVGAQDQKCAALGAGLQPGVVTLSLGTAGAFSKLWVDPATEGDMRIGWSAYVHDNFWVTEGVINTAGSSLRWLRDIMYPGCGYDSINAEASAALDCGSDLLFYPYLSGASSPDRYPDSTGCFYGANLATQRGDFALSVMEAIAFQTKIILDAMGGTDDIHTLVMFGGGAKSPLWCQIMADVLGIEILIPVTAEAAGAGTAILAGIAAGEFTRERYPTLPYGNSFKPSERQADYKKKYARYRSIEYKLWRGDASSNTQQAQEE